MEFWEEEGIQSLQEKKKGYGFSRGVFSATTKKQINPKKVFLKLENFRKLKGEPKFWKFWRLKRPQSLSYYVGSLNRHNLRYKVTVLITALNKPL